MNNPRVRNIFVYALILLAIVAILWSVRGATLAGAMPFKTSTIPVAIYLAYGVADISSMMALILLATFFAFAALLAMRLMSGERR